MKTKILLFLAMFLFAGIYGASAQQKAVVKQPIVAHQKVQNHRVKEGVKSGEITKGEHKVLAHRKHEIKKDVKLAKADGKVTQPEKKMIRNEQKKNSRLIHKTKHNS